jgi:hypothetical protein
MQQFRLWNNSPKYSTIDVSAHAKILKDDEYYEKSISWLEGYSLTYEAAANEGSLWHGPFQVQLDGIEEEYADYIVYEITLDFDTEGQFPQGEYTVCPDPGNEFHGATGSLLEKDDKAYSDYCGSSQNAKKKKKHR